MYIFQNCECIFKEFVEIFETALVIKVVFVFSFATITHFETNSQSVVGPETNYKIELGERQFCQLLKQKLTVGPTSIQRWIPASDYRRTVEMITMYCVGTTPVSNVESILVTNIFSTLAVNISKILVIYFYY